MKGRRGLLPVMPDDLTPRDAADAIAQTATFHQGAMGRAAALTWMVWALVWPLAMTVWANGGGGFGWSNSSVTVEPRWGLIGFALVMAWGAVTTGVVWHSFASKPETRLRPATSLATMAIFLPVGMGFLMAMMFALAQSWIHAGDSALAFRRLEILFVFSPNTTNLTGLWLLAASFSPWLGTRRRLTRTVGLGLVALGLLMNALRFADVSPSAFTHSIVTMASLGGAGLWLYRRG